MRTCIVCGYREADASTVCASCAKLDESGYKEVISDRLFKDKRYGLEFCVTNLILFAAIGYLPALLLIRWLPDFHTNFLLDALAWASIVSLGLTVIGYREFVRLGKVKQQSAQEEKRRKEEEKELERRRQVFKGIEHVSLFEETALGVRAGNLVIVKPSLKVIEIPPADIIDVELDEYEAHDGFEERPKVKQLNGPEGAYATATARAIQDSQPRKPKYKKQYKLKITVSDLNQPVLYFDAKESKSSVETWVGRIKALKHQAQIVSKPSDMDVAQ